MLHDRLQTMQRVCFAAEPDEADFESLGSADIWRIYRSMVRARLNKIVGVAFERTQSAIGEAPFEALVEDWLDNNPPATRFFRHVPRSFFDECLPTLEAGQPGWLVDLARYEMAEWQVKHAPSSRAEVREFSFDKAPVVNSALKLLRLKHPVQNKPTPRGGYAPEATQLCVYRDANHESVTWTLNPVAADLLEAWIPGQTTVTESVKQLGIATDEHFIEKLSGMLADFLQRGILLGSAP